MIQGMALGTGSSIGHKMVDSVLGEKRKEISNENIESTSTFNFLENNIECKHMLDKYLRCTKIKDEDCKIYLDLYIDCLEKLNN